MAEATAMPDAASLQRFLDGEYADVRDRTRAVLSSPEFAPVAGLSSEQQRERVLTLARKLAAAGETSLGFPTEYGGQANVGASVAAFESLAFGDLSLLVKTGVQFGLFGGAVLHLGTRAHHDAHLADIVSLALPGCFAMTETGHGSDVQSLGTTATYDPETQEFVVDTPHDEARKDYIGNAARDGRMAAVFAQLIVDGVGHGVHALLVGLRDADGNTLPGVRIEDCGQKLGLNGVDNGRIWFDAVRVPRGALLDRFAQVTLEGVYESAIDNPNKRFFTMLGTLIQGRVCVGGAAISTAKSALTIAVRYALRRRQFGPAGGESQTVLLDYRTHQRRLLPALATTYALHFAQETVVARLHRAFSAEGVGDRERRVLESQAAGLKALSTWHATHTIQACREACGGAGYLSENRFADLKADSDVFTTFEGDNTVLMQLVAKSLLTDYKDHFGDLNPRAMVAFVAGRVYETVVERTAAREIAGRVRDELKRDDTADLLDRVELERLFRWREEHLLSSAARRMKRGMDHGMDPFSVLIACQDHVISAARAHLQRVVLEAFAAAIERCERPELKALLEQVCTMYALADIEADRAWFQEHGRMSSTRAKATTRAVNRLCDDLRPHAALLVDAFGIPDAVLSAPIGLRGSAPADAVDLSVSDAA